MEGAHKVLHAPGPRAKVVTSYEPGPDLSSGLGGSPGEAGGGGAVSLSGVIKAGGGHIGECSST